MSTLTPRQFRAVLLAGLLCLPAPLYLGFGAEYLFHPDRAEESYTAVSADLDTVEGRETLLERFDTLVAVRPSRIDGEDADQYRAPNRTAGLVRDAIGGGVQTTDDADVMADLRAVHANYSFLKRYGQFYRFSVSDDGSRVEASAVDRDSLTSESFDRTAVDYASMPPAEQRAVDNIVDDATGTDRGSYRPSWNNPITDREMPMLVDRDGTLYVVVYEDPTSFTPADAGTALGLVVALIGLVLLVGAVIVSATGRVGPEDE